MSSEAAQPVSAATEAEKPVVASTPVASEAVEQKPAAEEAKPEVAPSTAQPADKEAVPETNPAAAPEETTAAPCEPNTTAEPAEKAAPATPLSKLAAELAAILKEADHNEMWGIELTDESHVPTSIVLEKFLRANNRDVAKAKAQLIEALKWRKIVDPIKLLQETEFNSAKFAGLGYVTVYQKAEGHEKEIVTWNIYGGTKDLKATFGNVDEFVKWRAALMELSVKELGLPSATEKIPENGTDPYRMIQVHDYLNVSFLRADPAVKAASKQTIQIFSMAYPELLKEKFFVNVPVIMGWFFTAMKVFLSAETVKKFHPLSYGSSLAGELPEFGQELPEVYGGKGKKVEEGLTVKYAGDASATK